MGQKEKTLIKSNLAALDPETQRRFRINAGMAWTGNQIRGPEILKYLNRVGVKNCLLIVKPRPFIGAPEGFPDVIGWDTVEITPDMVGQKIAVFVGDEYKATGRLSRVQKIFGDLLTRMGGRFRVVRD